MSAIFHDIFPYAFWLIVLVLFFYGVSRLARSRTPGTDLLTFLFCTAGLETVAVVGIIAAVVKADQWRRELDQQDEHDLIDQ
jgi:hypothetical protein